MQAQNAQYGTIFIFMEMISRKYQTLVPGRIVLVFAKKSQTVLDLRVQVQGGSYKANHTLLPPDEQSY